MQNLRNTSISIPIFLLSLLNWLKSPSKLSLLDYFGLKFKAKPQPIGSVPELAEFINSRASHVAQISLYGYLRTRAGTRYPELFERDDMLSSINQAKWQIWLACVHDLALFSGRLLSANEQSAPAATTALLLEAFDSIMAQVGEPAEAGAEFASSVRAVRNKIQRQDWQLLAEATDADCFQSSADALFHWSPISDELKQYDEEIVRNSIRFRWQAIRQYARANIQTAELINTTNNNNNEKNQLRRHRLRHDGA